jgi:sugar lactone lactonase YvrE
MIGNSQTPAVSLVLDAQAKLGEGSLWQPVQQKLYWIDIEGHKFHTLDTKTNKDHSLDVGTRIGTVVPTTDGNAIVALQNGIHKINVRTGKLSFLTNPLPDSLIRFNDGKCDPSGRFWVGSMPLNNRPGGASLYMIDKDFKVSVMLDNVTISNGIVWTKDKKTMYYNDTPTGVVQAFDYDDVTGKITNKRIAVKIPDGMGSPDGMTIDENDNIWVALWGGHCVANFDPRTGTLIQKVEVPAENVTSCAFGDEDLTTLYITTARSTNPDKLKTYPQSGGVFKVKPGVKGLPANFFKEK